MLKKSITVATVVAAVAAVAALAFGPMAQADDVNQTNIGRVDRPVHPNDLTDGQVTFSVWGTKLDSDADGNVRSDKNRATCQGRKNFGARRVQLDRCRLQVLVDFDGADIYWETLTSSPYPPRGPVNTGNTGRSVALTTRSVKYVCGFRVYRAVLDGAVRWNSNTHSTHQVRTVVDDWVAYGRADEGCLPTGGLTRA